MEEPCWIVSEEEGEGKNPLAGLRGAQVAGKMFLGVSVRVFQED